MSNRNNSLRIEIVDSLEKFSLLQHSWMDLLDESLDASIFMSWDWQYYWWKYYGKSRPLRLLLVFEEESNDLVGILPLYINTIKFFKIFPVRIIKFIGIGGDTSPDYLGPLLKNSYSQEIASALINYILNLKGLDVIELTDMHDNSVFATALSKACHARNTFFRQGTSANIAYLNLPQSWEEYLNSLHRDRRYTIRNTRRKLEKIYNVEFLVKKDEKNIDLLINRLIKLHHLRWRGRTNQHAFSSNEYIAFHRDVVHSLAKKDCIRFYCLEIDKEIMAMIYGYKFRSGIYYFQVGFDPKFEKLRLGLVLIGYAIEHSIQEGNNIFDFLKGDHEYKKQWTKEERKTIYLRIYHKWNIPAILFFIRLETIPKFKHYALKLYRMFGMFWRSKSLISDKAC